MKRSVFLKLIMGIAFLFVSLISLLAQEVVPPKDWAEVFSMFDTWFGTLAGLAALTVFLASYVIKWLNVDNSFWKQVTAIFVAMILCILMSVINFGFLSEVIWWKALIYGLATGLVSNGIFDAVTVLPILNKFLKHK
jgi:cell shape-determining protein MreD